MIWNLKYYSEFVSTVANTQMFLPGHGTMFLLDPFSQTLVKSHTIAKVVFRILQNYG